MKADLYIYRQGQAFAREMVATAPGNLSVQPIIDNLERSLANKPQRFADGVRSIIEILRGAQ
jgi:hypothetical protein